MAKTVAATLVLITLASAVPIIAHVWVMPVDISTHGHLIDEQMSSTMAEAGISFIAAQLLLAIFIWMFSGRKPDAKIHTFPGGAKTMVTAAVIFVGLDVDNDPDSKDDIVTAEMGVPVNKEIHLLMHAKDVGHSFYVRELRLQQDFVPGLDLSLHFTATKVGRYEIVCTQLCGLGHYNMKAYLSVMSQQDFEEWLKKQAASQ